MSKKDQPALPWISAIVSIAFAILLSTYLITGRIRVSSSRENAAYYIEYADRPNDFILISSLVGLLAIAAAVFSIVKFRASKKSPKSDL